MINLNLRQAIMQRLQNKKEEQLIEIIEDSVDGDEKTLPGLGVLFEIIWKNSDNTTKEQMISSLQQHISTANQS